MIYFDNAATTPLDENVLNKMMPYLKGDFGNASSQHGLGRKTANAVVSARDDIAKILGCTASEVYFTSSGTEADNWAVKGVCNALKGKGKHLIISAIEHPAVMQSALDLQKEGFELTVINPDECGIVSPQSVQNAIKHNTIFCAVMSANNETGVIQPVKEIGKVCKEAGVFYFCDCVQSAGVLPFDVESVDALSVSAHKFYGPKGAGALYLKKGSNISRLISGGHQERGLRAGTVNTAAIVGFAEALKAAYARLNENNDRILKLRNRFIEGVLNSISGTHLNGDLISRLPANANISFDGCDGENILFMLDLKGIAVSTGSACSSGAVTLSPVLRAMNLPEGRVKSAVRFTFGKYNTEEEVDFCIEVLKQTVSAIRAVNQ